MIQGFKYSHTTNMEFNNKISDYTFYIYLNMLPVSTRIKCPHIVPSRDHTENRILSLEGEDFGAMGVQFS